jgi:ADP-ribose pyrophosphatase
MSSNLPAGWKLITSEYLHHEAWLTVRRDQLQLPNGHVIPKYFVLEYPDWVNTIAITREGKFVLVRQYRHAIGKTSYELCAGVVDETDKDPLAAAKRELLEETGYSSDNWESWMIMAPNPATSNNWVHCFIAHGVEKKAEATPEDSEEITVHLFTAEEIQAMMMDGSIIQATHLTPLWKHFALRKNEIRDDTIIT